MEATAEAGVGWPARGQVSNLLLKNFSETENLIKSRGVL